MTTSRTISDRHLSLEVVWADHAQRMTIPRKTVFTAALANFSGYLWQKIPPQKI